MNNEQKALDLNAAGFLNREIAEMLDLSIHTIRPIMCKHDRYSVLKSDRVARMLSLGYSVEEIADELNTTVGSVRKMRYDLGIRIHKKGEKNG